LQYSTRSSIASDHPTSNHEGKRRCTRELQHQYHIEVSIQVSVNAIDRSQVVRLEEGRVLQITSVTSNLVARPFQPSISHPSLMRRPAQSIQHEHFRANKVGSGFLPYFQTPTSIRQYGNDEKYKETRQERSKSTFQPAQRRPATTTTVFRAIQKLDLRRIFFASSLATFESSSTTHSSSSCSHKHFSLFSLHLARLLLLMLWLSWRDMRFMISRQRYQHQ
jgi:hypothetical protein